MNAGEAMKKTAIGLIALTVAALAGCGGASRHAGPDPATVRACKDLRQFMNGSASDSLVQDPFRFRIFAAMRPGSRFRG
jgi:hypothetical protein